MRRPAAWLVLLAMTFGWLQCPVMAGVGDPQIETDHPWYPGELACSTFERLFATQDRLYERVTGRHASDEQDQALASWLWRNTHYAHGEEGAEDLWGTGFERGPDLRTRDYWTGLFAHGFGLCGTTHSQWVAEFEARFGHNRARGVGVDGHNSFEVLLQGGNYGTGKWVLLDHDISTVIFNSEGTGLLSIAEVKHHWQQLTNRKLTAARQNGWLVCGLHPDDGGVYRRYEVAEYLAGYSGPPPMVHLRQGETLRRYHQPGLEDGRTFVFWGRNYRTAGIPGPERSLTWVNQPDAMFRSQTGAGYKPGQVRYANAVFTYRPDFRGGYREGIVEESDEQVVFEFQSPYIIGATPPDDSDWGIYRPGGRNGLIVTGTGGVAVSVSVDRGRTWAAAGKLTGSLDLTDAVKGRRQYFLKFHAGAPQLVHSEIRMTTVCQANSAILPRLQDNETQIRFAASQQAVVSAGPNLEQAQSHVIEGKFGSPRVTLQMDTPRGEPVVQLYAVAHIQSSNPPSPEVKYQIEYSTDQGRHWLPVVNDWQITRRGDEPADFWSQSLCWGTTTLDRQDVSSVRIRFRNDGGKNYARCEAHLVYRTPGNTATNVAFQWRDAAGGHTARHRFEGADPASWNLPTGKSVQTEWVEFEPAD